MNNMQSVMIVDDHEVFRLGLIDLLNAVEGFHVVAQADSCKDALVQLETKPVDLVLLDLYMSGAEGIDALQQMRKNHPQLHVIILSATMDDDLLLSAVLAGVSGYLTKDTPAVDIAKALQAYQRGNLAMLPSVVTRTVSLLVQQNNLLEAKLTLSQSNEMNTLDGQKAETAVSALTPSTLASNLSPQGLTSQEEKVFQLMRRGLSNKQIATQLFISHFTVGKHVQNILRKLGVTNRTQAVSYSLFEGDGEPLSHFPHLL